MSKRCMGCMETYGEELNICPYCGYIEGTEAEEAIHIQPGTLLHDRYIIGKVLGFGGFGVTYIAWDSTLEQSVAIKEYLPSEFSTRMPGQTMVTVFHGDKGEQFQEGLVKFVDEARRLAKFQNENGIVKIFDSFTENDTAYIVMEYLEGETLTEKLKRENTISEEEALAIITPVLSSLKVVHNAGIIHRDIAPDNIFLTKNGEVKLIDFGASRFATTTHSRSLTVIIKPGYSPEEQYRSRGDQGPHTDVYSLAAVLYKMLTGKTPPDAMERRAKIETQKKDILVAPHKLNKSISKVHENALLNAMNVQVEDRTPDIPSFEQELFAEVPVARRYGKIKKIDLYTWPLWLKILLLGVAAAICAFCILLATGVFSFSSLFSSEVVVPEKMVIVPDVENMNKDEAVRYLETLKLLSSASGNVESEYIEPGMVILQSPNAGSYAYEYGTVYLTISSGKAVAEAVDGISVVPYVVWDTKEVAITKLLMAGLAEPEIIELYDSTDAGKVIDQSLPYGTEVAEGTCITLYVSLGLEKQVVPNVKNLPEADAIKRVEDVGLLVIVERKNSDDTEEGRVISQSIEAGTYVSGGETVVLTVSEGKPQKTDEQNNAASNDKSETGEGTDAFDGETGEAVHIHSYTSTVSKKESCGEDGIRIFTCSCGMVYSEPIKATGQHSYVSRVVAPAEVGKPGVKEYTCLVCNSSFTESIPALEDESGVKVTKEAASSEPTGELPIKQEGEIAEGITTEPVGDEASTPLLSPTAVPTDVAVATPVATPTAVPAITQNPGQSTAGITASVNVPTQTVEPHTHSYTSKVVRAETCGSSGEILYRCACGVSYTDTIAPKGQHNYRSEVISEPTTTSKGTRKYTCTVCGQFYTEGIDKLQADDNKQNGGGTDAEPKHTIHSYTSKYDVLVEVSCGTPGLRICFCSCGESVSEEIPATGNHDFVSETVNNLSGKPIAVKYKCKVCGYNYQETIDQPEHVHKYTMQITKQANCGSTGIKTFTCACGDSYTDTIPATGSHTFSDKITTEATCIKQGIRTYTCTVCGDSKTETIPATGVHTMVEKVTKEPTCGEAGEKTISCTGCGISETEELPATGNHSFAGEDYVPEYAGQMILTCKVCGATKVTFVDSMMKSPEHNFVKDEVIKKGNCNEPSTYRYKCTDCGETKTITIHDTNDHVWEYVSTQSEANCAFIGHDEYKCSLCGVTLPFETPINPNKHEPIRGCEIIKNPTCGEAGYSEEQCVFCGTLFDRKEIPPTGRHDYVKKEIDGVVTFACSVCGQLKP